MTDHNPTDTARLLTDDSIRRYAAAMFGKATEQLTLRELNEVLAAQRADLAAYGATIDQAHAMARDVQAPPDMPLGEVMPSAEMARLEELTRRMNLLEARLHDEDGDA